MKKIVSAGHAFTLDIDSGKLFRDKEEPVPLTGKQWKLLCFFVERPGKLFSQAELLDAVWEGAAVTPEAVGQAIRGLRKALGDDPGSPFMIETEYGRGYRFIAEVQEIPRSEATAKTTHQKIECEDRDDKKFGHQGDLAADLFLCGAGIGNRLAIAPIPPGTAGFSELDELLSIMSRIGISESPSSRTIKEVRNKLIGENGAKLEDNIVRSLLDNYFSSMKEISAVVRSSCDAPDYLWFKFGELLFGTVTFSMFQTSEEDGVNQICPDALALEAIIEHLDIPDSIKSQVRDFVELSKDAKGADTLMPVANQIASTVYALF